MSMNYMFRTSSLLLLKINNGITIKKLAFDSQISYSEIFKKNKMFLEQGIITFKNSYPKKYVLTLKGLRVKEELQKIFGVL